MEMSLKIKRIYELTLSEVQSYLLYVGLIEINNLWVT